MWICINGCIHSHKHIVLGRCSLALFWPVNQWLNGPHHFILFGEINDSVLFMPAPPQFLLSLFVFLTSLARYQTPSIPHRLPFCTSPSCLHRCLIRLSRNNWVTSRWTNWAHLLFYLQNEGSMCCILPGLLLDLHLYAVRQIISWFRHITSTVYFFFFSHRFSWTTASVGWI